MKTVTACSGCGRTLAEINAVARAWARIAQGGPTVTRLVRGQCRACREAAAEIAADDRERAVRAQARRA